MSQGFWRVYKAKVLQTFNAEQEGESQEENDIEEMIEPETPNVQEEGINMSQLARKVQGALGWKTVTSIFNKEEEQRAEQIPEQAAEPTPVQHSPEVPPERSPSALWGVFTSRWQQNTIERSEERGVLTEPPTEASETQHQEESPFRWGFLTSKLSELRSKNE